MTCRNDGKSTSYTCQHIILYKEMNKYVCGCNNGTVNCDGDDCQLSLLH